MAYIYKITNKVNNKIYIGQTVQSINHRWRQHVSEAYGESKCAHLHAAIRKYGEDNFTVEKIEECSQNQLNEKEEYWINYYNSYREGYNLTCGGDGVNKQVDQAVLEKLWDEGLTVSEIGERVGFTRQWVRQRLLQYDKYSQEESNARGVNKCKKSKGHCVYQLDDNRNIVGIFNSIKEATEKTGITNISRSCLNHTRAGNYYWVYKEDYERESV